MSPDQKTADDLLARVREAAKVPPYTYEGGDSGDHHTGWEVLASRFAELDAWMSHGGQFPREWRK